MGATTKRRGSIPKDGEPIFSLHKPLPISFYRPKFHPFESTKYLDERALKAKKKVTIECGTIEAGGRKQTVAAEIRDGMIVALRPVGCTGCGPDKPKKPRRTLSKQVLRQIGHELTTRGLVAPFKPKPLKISRQSGISIPIGDDITVLIFYTDICLMIWTGSRLCFYCIFLNVGCLWF